jgi:hypothetical protein
MIKKLLFGASAFCFLATGASAQLENVPVKRNLNVANGTKEAVETKTLVEKNSKKSFSKMSSNLSDGSLYYYSNARKINGNTTNYFYTSLKDDGTNYLAAWQLVPNSAEITLDSLEFFAESLGDGTTANVEISILEGTNSFVDTVQIDDTWNWKTITFKNTIELSSDFYIVIKPVDNLADSFDIARTGSYADNDLFFDADGIIGVYDEYDTLSTVQLTTGDFLIEPYFSYVFEDVTSSVSCLTNDNEEVVFTSLNAGILENPIWNYNAYVHARFIVEDNSYFYTAVNIAEQNFADTNILSGYNYTFPTPGQNTVQYTERVAQWLEADPVDNITTINLDLCTSVEEVQNDNLASIYPNPAKDILNVNLANDNATLTVFDLTGKVIMMEQLINRTNRINVSELTNGFYVYNVRTLEGEFTTGNFVVNK